jgi:hypothetical protein
MIATSAGATSSFRTSRRRHSDRPAISPAATASVPHDPPPTEEVQGVGRVANQTGTLGGDKVVLGVFNRRGEVRRQRLGGGIAHLGDQNEGHSDGECGEARTPVEGVDAATLPQR